MATHRPVENEDAGAAADLPPAFDADHYLAANPELGLTRDEAADHYARTGRAGGRIASPLALRENLIALIDDGRSVLEIGPFCNPLLRGPNIAYLDVLDADQLRARAVEIGADPAGCPERIDYVGGLEKVRRRFDAVISSHAIEHQPDLVHHLQQVERILAPDGLFCLIIPDKRYCFDHHIAESTIAGVLQAHREQRKVHSLASVVEHVALTTHNDSRRHWAGDHGPAVPADRTKRVEKALSDHDFGLGGYIDVHAWYFTPDRFAEIVGTLGELGLTGFEVAGVYDSAHGRNEFCAVLRLSPAARQRALEDRGDSGILFLQTSDADRYAPMLALTAANIREYCRRQGCAYESHVGIKRGFHPWQATFNRIPMLVELVERGFAGWAVYLDADAYIQDLDFDVAAYLADKDDKAAIFATSGVTGAAWDVNAGVALINLGHPQGRALVASWAARFAAHSDDFLREAVEWIGPGNDQDLLHHLLREEPAIAAAVLVEPMSFINGPHASFIRQQLRTLAPSFEMRLEAVAEAVSQTLRGAGRAVPVRASEADQRWSARLAHQEGRRPGLVEAALPAVRADLVEQILADWNGAGAAPVPAHQRALVDAFDRGDAGAVGAELAGLGRSQVAQGFLGGSRQHDRARSPDFAGKLARWTYDKLVSLAEAVGAIPLENPESGSWGENALVDPAELFEAVEAALGADLSPPELIGGHLGIAVDRGRIVHMRMLDAVHAAWRLRQLGEVLGQGRPLQVAEIGGGAGLNAFYARRLGLGGYRLFDTPAMTAVQRYVLGEEASPAGLTIADEASFGASEPGSIDLLLNSDSLPVLPRDAAIEHLRAAGRIGIRHILSINQEAAQPGQAPVAELVRDAGGWRLASRHRHWLRTGYAEEHFIRFG
jgi:SAM-dependent methyltransferase